mgnify:CR=1 FL=1
MTHRELGDRRDVLGRDRAIRRRLRSPDRDELAVDLDHVSAELADAVRDLRLGARADRGDGDQRRHADDDAERRQERRGTSSPEAPRARFASARSIVHHGADASASA